MDINEYNCSSPTMCFLEGDTVKLNLNIRLNAGVSKEAVYAMVKSFEEQYECKTKIKELILPSYVDPDSTEMKLMLQAYKEVLGVDTKVNFAMGTGYNAALPNCAIFGPRFSPEQDEDDLCHCDNESRKIDDLVNFEKMLVTFIMNYLKSYLCDIEINPGNC
jgi:acetylornithine deacetylase/succinyl-diaminopimelate desuccinylase-like protein